MPRRIAVAILNPLLAVFDLSHYGQRLARLIEALQRISRYDPTGEESR